MSTRHPLFLVLRLAVLAALLAVLLGALLPAAAEASPATPGRAPIALAPPRALDLGEDAPPSPVQLKAFAIGAGVDGRRLVGQAEAFTARGQRIWAHVTVANPGPATRVDLLWKHEGQLRWTSSLEIGRAPAWRSWARWTLNPLRDLGRWEIEAVDASGRHLGAVEILVLPPAAGAEAAARGPDRDAPGC